MACTPSTTRQGASGAPAATSKPATGGRRFATVSHCTRDNGRQPYIRLTGQWLREAGFDLGTEFEIDITHGRLTLEAFPDP